MSYYRHLLTFQRQIALYSGDFEKYSNYKHKAHKSCHHVTILKWFYVCDFLIDLESLADQWSVIPTVGIKLPGQIKSRFITIN